MQSLLRIFVAAWKNIFRNIWLSLAVVLVMSLTLITVNGLLVLHIVTESAIAAIHEQVDIEVSFLPGTSQEVEKAVRGYALSLTQVRDVTLVSKDLILEEFRANHAHDADVLAALEEVGGNPFGDVARITVKDPKDAGMVREALKSPEFLPHIATIDSPDYEAFTQNIVTLTERLRLFGAVLTGFFGFISFLMLVNALRVTMFVHKDEIFIMRLVGAKSWFISGPFLLETVFLALISAIFVTVFLWGVLPTVGVWLQTFFATDSLDLSDFYIQNITSIISLELGILLFFALLTTWLAMRKYLRA